MGGDGADDGGGGAARWLWKIFSFSGGFFFCFLWIFRGGGEGGTRMSAVPVEAGINGMDRWICFPERAVEKGGGLSRHRGMEFQGAGRSRPWYTRWRSFFSRGVLFVFVAFLR